MHAVSHRRERLADQIRNELTELVGGDLKDPRIGLAAVTGVELSADMRHVRVWVTVSGDEGACRETMDGLAAASAYVRREIATRLNLRRAPEFAFVLDRGSIRVAELLDSLENGQPKNLGARIGESKHLKTGNLRRDRR